MEPFDDWNALRFECPRCGHSETDDFEVIDRGIAVNWRCESCRRLFSVLFTECENCGFEGVQTALTGAEQENTTDVLCRRCGKPSLHHEHLAESGTAR